MDMERDTNQKSSSTVVKNHSFDCIPIGEEAKAFCRTYSPVEEIRDSSTRQHLQVDKSTVYLVSSPQETCYVHVEGTNSPEKSNPSLSSYQAPLTPPKQRRYGVSEVATEQRQRKAGICESKQSVSDRTFLRVLHKKF